jgi:hypothetical protein
LQAYQYHNIGVAIEVKEQCTILLAISHDYSVVRSAILAKD